MRFASTEPVCAKAYYKVAFISVACSLVGSEQYITTLCLDLYSEQILVSICRIGFKIVYVCVLKLLLLRILTSYQ